MAKEVVVKVRILRSFSGTGFSHKKGALLELPSKEASAYVKAGFAERTEYDDKDFKKVKKDLDAANKSVKQLEKELAEAKQEITRLKEIEAKVAGITGLLK